jgi:hypothetical protein
LASRARRVVVFAGVLIVALKIPYLLDFKLITRFHFPLDFRSIKTVAFVLVGVRPQR